MAINKFLTSKPATCERAAACVAIVLTLSIAPHTAAQTDAQEGTELEQTQPVVEPARERVEEQSDETAATVRDLQERLDEQARASAETGAGVADLADLLDAQRRQIEQQRRRIAAQEAQLARQQEEIAQQRENLATQADLLQAMQTQIDEIALAQDETRQLSEEDIALRDRLDSLESQVAEIPEDPSILLMGAEDFPGSLRLPGTSASLRIGGYAKANVVKNFDPLLSQDRFIVGTIPAGDASREAIASETNLTANQTRLNLELRQQTPRGQFRGFVEGDFAASGDSFRLRHAYGQYGRLLGGKYWSGFYDERAVPEGLDFEGINGRVVVRQAQIRFFPSLGEQWDLAVGLEDPSPAVGNGIGVSDLPDVTVSIRRTWFQRWHGKTAFLLRQIRAVSDAGNSNAGDTLKETGWGLTLSGRLNMPFMPDDDVVLFQVNAGKGIGRYINDLNAIGLLSVEDGGGGQDAVIDPLTGRMETLGVLAGYVSYQHWWADKLRSTFVVSMVDVDNEDFQLGNAYKRTSRLTGNLIWSPVPRVDLGAELLWGKRENKDSSSDTSTQWQFAGKFKF